MSKIKALPDLRIIRDLEMIFTAEPVEPEITDSKFDLIQFSPEPVITLYLIGIITGASHDAYITEFRR